MTMRSSSSENPRCRREQQVILPHFARTRVASRITPYYAQNDRRSQYFPAPDSAAKPRRRGNLDADVFVPKLGTGGDEIPHQVEAFRVLQHLHLHTQRADIILGPFESGVLANDDVGDLIEEGGTAAHRAGRKRGVKRALLIDGGLETARIFQAIHFRVMNDTALLDALVVA